MQGTDLPRAENVRSEDHAQVAGTHLVVVALEGDGVQEEGEGPEEGKVWGREQEEHQLQGLDAPGHLPGTAVPLIVHFFNRENIFLQRIARIILKDSQNYMKYRQNKLCSEVLILTSENASHRTFLKAFAIEKIFYIFYKKKIFFYYIKR